MSTDPHHHHATAPGPRSANRAFIADGGLETTLVFHEGIDLPDFAAFPLIDDAPGRAVLEAYFDRYFSIARRHDLGVVVDTATWRANPDWAQRLGYDHDALAANNRRAADFARVLANNNCDVESVVNGVIGPRGDGYVVSDAMTTTEAASYHSLQVRALAEAGVDMVTAVTMTHVGEAVGVVRAAVAVDLPVVVSFTTETDGRLPSGMELGEAISEVDAATDSAAAWFMINCAHPTHFEHALAGGAPWLTRIQAVRANASRMSHAELDEAEQLDRGDPAELAGAYARLRNTLPGLRIVGGCCGTDHEHVAAMASTIAA